MMHWERTVLDLRLPNSGNMGGCAYQGGEIERLLYLELTSDPRIWEFNGSLWVQRENTGLSWGYTTLLAAGPSGEVYALDYVYYWPVWEFSVRDQSRGWTSLTIPVVSTGQNSMGFVVDEARGKAILVFDPDDPGGLRTVEYDIATDTWGSSFSGPTDQAVENFQMAFDRERGKVVFYGGWTGSVPSAMGLLFELEDDETWTEITPSGAEQPAARYAVGLSPDPERGGVRMFGGGKWMGGGSFRMFGGTWNLSPGNVWTPLHAGAEPVFTDAGGAGGELARIFTDGGALQYMTARGRFATVGGESANARWLGEPADPNSEQQVMEYLADPPGPWPCPRCGPRGVVE